ncbi:glycosyltransferase family 61 protein [Shewanella sp. SM101]|uniref:glycosyltransferase family 61 protein n=1 Tax=Shewanella sp. SM101 TaxID=2912789 RepID=UPI0021D9AAB4|nr:glycosyltransferase family 61 protein [Shewanella sp. SM101]MCU8104644.1 glycosyltransferase family 61 protein [Shewanella sp. SM101]
MSFIKTIFIRELKKTKNRFKLNVLLKVANFFSSKNKKIVTKMVRYLDLAILNRKVILPEIIAKTYLPNYTFVESVKFIEVVSPEVQIVEFENYIISGSCSSFINDNYLFIERYCNEDNENSNYNSGCLLSHDNTLALILEDEITNINSGFFLIGNGSWNYYHWLIEILPKLQFYLELGLYKRGVKLLVSDTVKENANFKFLLDSILGDIKVDIVFVPRNFSLNVKHLYHLTPINNILFNEREAGIASNILHLRFDSLTFVKSKTERVITSSNNKMFSADRIFLARKEGKMRGYNQSDIIPLLLKHKFKIIYMEDHDIKQQIFLFQNARYIVGASGAAWANLIYCNNSCKALTWLPESVKHFPAFSTLAKFANVKLFFFNTVSSHCENINGNYIIDISLFKRNLEFLLE